MRRIVVVAASVGAFALPLPAGADVGARLSTVSIAAGESIRGVGTAGMPVYLVPERRAPRPYSCQGGRAYCRPRSFAPPRAPYLWIGTIAPGTSRFSPRRFSLGTPRSLAPGRYQVVLWCRPCGRSLILAGATMYGQVVTVRPRSDVVRLVPLEPKRVAHCRRSRLLAPICPRLVPRVRAPYLSHLARGLTRPRPLDVFNLERGGQSPDHPERNRPPAMAHLVIAAGNVRGLSPVWRLGVRHVRLQDMLMHEPRPFLLRFGPYRWAGRKGWLELAPPYLRGGVLGNHLIFRWRADGREYLVSLHAWEPLMEAADTLRRIVASTPRP